MALGDQEQNEAFEQSKRDAAKQAREDGKAETEQVEDNASGQGAPPTSDQL